MTEPSSSPTIRILHVDDEELLLKFAKQFIEQYDPDIEVESIDSPVKALKKLDEQQYDCIVSDYQMPQMDCIELARRVREFSQVPFIIYTGRGSEEVAEMAFSVGVDDYLRKEHDPAHYQVLTRRIRTAVEKHRVEENLRSSREMYRTLLQESIDAVLVISSSKFVYLNRFATELFGYSDSSELLEKDSSGFIVPEDRERVIENAMARQRGEESPDRYELKLLRRDGDMVDVEAHISLIDYEGKPASLIFCRDITERKKMEEELRKHSEHLEKLVEEKTLELLDAERMVTAGRIASMVGHDLKSPLQTIRNAAHLLREVPEQKDEMLDMIENSVTRADELIEDFRSNVRDTPLMLVTADLGALIEAAVEEAGIPDSVFVSLEVEGVEAVSLDTSKIRRVLDNLIGNAVEAMPEGGVLKIAADRREKEIVIEVTDTGVGISEEEMLDLFKPFHTTKLKGLGLGLTFCKRAVEAHGGSIAVESKVSEGSKFTVRISLKVE